MTSTFEERTIELSIISAVDLKNVKTLGTQQCYVSAYIYHNQRKETQPDRAGGLNPVWNTKLSLECEEQFLHAPNASLTVDIKSRGTLRNKLVGTVVVPLHELLAQEESKKTSQAEVMAYDVYRPSGKIQGTLNMAVKLGEVRTVQRYRSQQTPFGYPQQAGPSYRPQYAPPHMQQPYPYQQGQYYGGGYPHMQAPMGYSGGMGGHGFGGMGGHGYGGYPQQRPRRGGMGFGTGLLGGALGGLLVGDMIDDAYDNDYNGNDYNGDDYGGGDMDDMGGE